MWLHDLTHRSSPWPPAIGGGVGIFLLVNGALGIGSPWTIVAGLLVLTAAWLWFSGSSR